MEPIDFRNAYYIKLGRKDAYAKSSITGNTARIGYSDQTLGDIWQEDWLKIRQQLKAGHTNEGATTHDLNMLKTFVESTPFDCTSPVHRNGRVEIAATRPKLDWQQRPTHLLLAPATGAQHNTPCQ